MTPRLFEGATVGIVAGGPSLTGFDFRQMDDRRHLVINRAHEFLPRAEAIWWTDAKYWRRASASLIAHGAALKATGNLEYKFRELHPCVTQYLFTGPEGFDEFPEHLRHGWNSTHAATHLLVHLGARRIVLFGADFRHGATAQHFHSGYGEGTVLQEAVDRWKGAFSKLAPILAAKGIEVINASPDSALTVFRKTSIADGLSLLDRRPDRQ